MNAITEVPAVSAQTLETVLGTGDLAKLSTQQRVEYYARTCQSLGLNPLTRPFRFLSLNGQIQLYATRDCTDQLRKVHGITLHVVDKQIDGDLFIVTVRARTKDGREDEDMGAVALGTLRGESRANALMKGMTKAKRRVTLSVCGLGLTDESELDTMAGAQVFDHDERPPTPIRAAAAATPEAPLKRQTLREWMTEFDAHCAAAQTPEEASKVLDAALVMQDFLSTRPAALAQYNDIRAACIARLWPEPPDDLPEVEIRGEANVGAG